MAQDRADPRATSRRAALLEVIAARIPRPTDRPALVAVDGPDGSGKTWFAEALAEVVRRAGRTAHLVHVDDFHHLRAVRHRRGRDSPEGFFLDSYDYGAFQRLVLEPVRAGGALVARSADLEADVLVDDPPVVVAQDDVVLVEGIFLHRDELAGRWDLSVFLDVPFEETARRMAVRDGTSVDLDDPHTRRYVEGQRIYFRECTPQRRATLVVDNADPAHPRLRH